MREVAHYVDESQFENSPVKENQFLCGYVATFQNAAAGHDAPLHDGEWIDQQADKAYTEITHLQVTDLAPHGMSLLEEFYCLHLAGLHYQNFVPSKVWVDEWVGVRRYPVMISLHEDSIFDLELGDKPPYAWAPSGNHIITVTDVDPDHNTWYCRDTASIGKGGVRPGPRPYDREKIQLVTCTVVVLPWLPRPLGPNPFKEPQAPAPRLHTIVGGENLYSIGQANGVSFAELLNKNLALLDEVAREHGYRNSDNGHWIFPGTVIKL